MTTAAPLAIVLTIAAIAWVVREGDTSRIGDAIDQLDRRIAALEDTAEPGPKDRRTVTRTGDVFVSMPQSTAEGRTSPQTAAKLRGGYTTEEYALIAGVSVRTVQEWCRTGEVSAVKSDNGHYLIEIGK